jgi:hypothetical protein
MCLSVAFIVVDILSVTSVLKTGSINPFWKFSFVFKCFTDTIVLDDFKTALDRLSQYKMDQLDREAGMSLKIGPVFGQIELGRPVEFRTVSWPDRRDPLELDTGSRKMAGNIKKKYETETNFTKAHIQRILTSF